MYLKRRKEKDTSNPHYIAQISTLPLTKWSYTNFPPKYNYFHIQTTPPFCHEWHRVKVSSRHLICTERASISIIIILGSTSIIIIILRSLLMQRRCVEVESITHKYCNSSTKPKFYKNTRLIGKIIEKTSLANFYSKTHIT